MLFTIHADGGARGNPGPAGAGAVVRDELGTTVATVSKFLGHQTNNVAEYEAVILAFDEVLKLSKGKAAEVSVVVKMDSLLVVRQMQGEWRVKHPNMKPQYARLVQKAGAFKSVTFTHIPREQNGDADTLANDAMDRGA